jgi:hypothetical protein
MKTEGPLESSIMTYVTLKVGKKEKQDESEQEWFEDQSECCRHSQPKCFFLHT